MPGLVTRSPKALVILLAALCIACIAAPAAGAAVGGSLSQLAEPQGCIAETPAANECGDVTGLANPGAIALDGQGDNVYVTGGPASFSSLTAYERLDGGALQQLDDPATGGTVEGCLTHIFGRGDCSAVSALVDPSSVVVSPDRQTVYVGSYWNSAIVVFRRDLADGSLSWAGCLAPFDSGYGESDCATQTLVSGVTDLALSPGGDFLYAVGGGSVGIFSVSTAPGVDHGMLTPLTGEDACWSDSGAGPWGGTCHDARALNTAQSIALSPTGDFAYVTGYASNGVAVFGRDAASGKLTQAADEEGCVREDGAERCLDVRGMGAPLGVVVSPDGDDVYVNFSGGVSAFRRDVTDGSLRQSGKRDGCWTGFDAGKDCKHRKGIWSTSAVAISPNGDSLYVGASYDDSVTAFERRDGDLRSLPGSAGCQSASGYIPSYGNYHSTGNCVKARALEQSFGVDPVVVSPDGKNVYVAAAEGNAVAVMKREGGRAAFEPDRQTWDLAEDMGDPVTSNPFGDRYGNAGVWRAARFAGAADGSDRSPDSYQLLTTVAANDYDYAGWADTDSRPFVASFNESIGHVVPATDELAVVGWRNKTGQTITANIAGMVSPVERWCGDGVRWYLDHQHNGTNTNLRTGFIAAFADPDGTYAPSASFEFDQPNVAPEDTIWLVVAPEGPASCDATDVDLRITGPVDGGPQTYFDGGSPRGLIGTATPQFRFKSNLLNPSDGFECRVDGSGSTGWSPCTSPYTTPALSQGQHTVEVRAKDAGVADPSPAKRTVTVDTIAPAVTVDSGPSGSTRNSAVQFTFTAGEAGSRTYCSLDSAAFERCDSPKSYDLEAGPHRFDVRAKDPAGNTGGATTRNFTVVTGADGLQPGALAQLTADRGCFADNPTYLLSVTGDDCPQARGIQGSLATAVSPDGKSVYATGFDSSSVATFDRAADGSLVQKAGGAGCHQRFTGYGGCAENATGLLGAAGVVVSHDGRNVYVAGYFDDAIATFSRDTTAGATLGTLTYTGCVSLNGTLGCAKVEALDAPIDIALSPTDDHLYVATEAGGSVVVLDRDTTDGTLTQPAGLDACYSDTGSAGKCRDGRAMGGMVTVDLTDDGTTLYSGSTSGAIQVFRVNPDGTIRQLGGEDGCVNESGAEECYQGRGLSGMRSLDVSPDGANVYAAFGDGISIFDARDNGGLQQSAGRDGCFAWVANGTCTYARGADEVMGLVVSQDGRNVYANNYWEDVLTVFRRSDDGDLVQLSGPDGCWQNDGRSGECRNARAIATAFGNEPVISPDGRSLYMNGRDYSGTLTAFQRGLPAAAGDAQPLEWDGFADFVAQDPGQNPTADRFVPTASSWSYLKAPAAADGSDRDPATYSLLTEFSSTPRNGRTAGWFETGATGGWAGVGPEVYSDDLFVVPDDPATGGESIVTRWENPLAGTNTFEVSVQLVDSDRFAGDGIDWYLDRGATPVAQGHLGVTGNIAQNAEASLELTQGEKLDLVVSPHTGHDWDGTRVRFHIVGPAESGPGTTITGGPRLLTNDVTPAFAFSTAAAAPFSFECRWDRAGSWDPCTSGSPKATALDPGEHTFEVRAKKGTAVDLTPSSRTFTVDTQAPTTTITGGPSQNGTIRQATTIFTTERSEPGVTECRIDSASAAAFEACTSPYTTPELTDGTHTIDFRTRDRAGNNGPIVSRTFRVVTGAGAFQPGALAQLTGIAGCAAETTPLLDGSACDDGRGLAQPVAGAVTADGAYLYSVSQSDSSLTVWSRGLNGSLTQLAAEAGCVRNGPGVPGECGGARAMFHPAGVATFGDNVYTAQLDDSSIAVFKRNGDGSLSQLAGEDGCVRDQSTADGCASGRGLSGASAIAVSPDGRHVYVASYYGSQVAVFDRDLSDGSLSQPAGTDACWSETGSGGLCRDGRALNGAHRLVVTAEDVYVSSYWSWGVAAFKIGSDGRLTQPAGPAGCILDSATGQQCAEGQALGYPDGLAISPDGASVYVSSRWYGGIAVLRREPDGGLGQELDANGCLRDLGGACRDVDGISTVGGLVVSPDGHNVYAVSADAGGSVTAFSRDSDGTLAQLPGIDACWAETGGGGRCRDGKGLGYSTGLGIVASPDGGNVYTFNETTKTIASFDRRKPAPADQAPLQVWSLAGDYRPAPDQANPQGDRIGNAAVWSFRHFDGSGTGDDRAPANFDLLTGFTGGYWHDVDGFPAAGIFVGGRFTTHPGPGDSSVIGWRNPTGQPITVDVSAAVQDQDGGGGDGVNWYLDNGTAQVGGGVIPNGSPGQSADATETVPAGGSLWLTVAPRGGYDYDTTWVDLSITGPAEPGPQTRITGGPKTTTNDATPEFTFTGGTAFECRVDATGAFTPCTSGSPLSTLADGFHTFEVRTTAPGIDATPARQRFRVDATEPNVIVESGPDGLTRDRTPTWQFELAQAEPVVYECRLDSTSASAWQPCLSPFTAPELVSGSHTLDIRAIDRALNADSSPAHLTFVVDTLPSGLQFGGLAQLTGTDGCISETGSGGACADGNGVAGASSSVVSPDGRFLYAASPDGNQVTVFQRGPGSRLTQLGGAAGCVSDSGDGLTCADVNGMARPENMALSAGGEFLYVAGRNSSSIAAFSRDATTGQLTQLAGVKGCVADDGDGVTCADARALNRPWSLEVAGDALYAVSYDDWSIAAFQIEADGSLSQLAGADGCVRADSTAEGCRSARHMSHPLDLAVVGSRAYVGSATSNAITVFARTANGALSQLASTNGCVRWYLNAAADCTRGRNMAVPYELVASPDGKQLYVADQQSGAIAIFGIDGADGTLAQSSTAAGCWSENGTGNDGTTQDACENGKGMVNAAGIAMAPDGRTVYLSAPYGDNDGEGAIAIFKRTPSNGTLTQLGGLDGCWSQTGRNGTCRDGKAMSSSATHAVTVSPDGLSVYLAARDSGVAVFDRRKPRDISLPAVLEWDLAGDFNGDFATAVNPTDVVSAAWTYLRGNGGGTGATRSSAGYAPLTQKINDGQYRVAWRHTATDTDDFPWVGLDRQRHVTVAPGASAPAVLRWKYQHSEPMAVEVHGLIADANAGCGDGIRWYLDVNGARQASGRVYNGDRPDNVDRTVAVAANDVIELVVAANGDADCDDTRVDLKVTGSPIADTTFLASSPEGLINDPTPEFQVDSTEAGATFTMRYYLAGTDPKPPFVATPATFTIGPLADGEYVVEALSTGDTTPATRSIKVDATAPPVTVATLDLSPFADGVTKDTNDNLPTFAGAAGDRDGTLPTSSKDDDTVTLRVWQGTNTAVAPIRSWTVSRTGATWTSQLQGGTLPEGTYTIQAIQGDAAANTGTSVPRVFKIDRTVPVVTITRPVSSGIVANPTPTNDRSPRIEGTSGSNDGTAATQSKDAEKVTVELWDGTSATAAPPRQSFEGTRAADGSWFADVPVDLPDGTYTVRAKQLDGAGNQGTSAQRTFRVDTVPPAVVLDQPAQNLDTKDNTPLFSGTMGQSTGTTDPRESTDDSTLRVNVHSGSSTAGALVGFFTATRDAGANTWSVSVPTALALADGTYTAQAVQQDAAGNAGSSNMRTFKVDTVAPKPTVTGPTTVSGPIHDTNDQTPAITGVAGHEDGTHVARSADDLDLIVRVLNNDGTERFRLDTTANALTGAYAVDVPAAETLPEGTYKVEVLQSDNAGNDGASDLFTFKVDVTRPVVTVAQPADGVDLNVRRPSFSGTAGNEDGSHLQRSADVMAVIVDLYAGDTATGTPVTSALGARSSAASTAWTATLPAGVQLADGRYTVVARQFDAAANEGTSTPVHFRVDTIAPKPTVTGRRDTNDTTPGFTGVAGTNPGDAASPTSADRLRVDVRVYAGTAATGPVVASADADRDAATGAYSIDAVVPASGTELSRGTYTIVALQSDDAGNEGASDAFTFKIDTIAPSPTVTTPAEKAATNDRNPVVGGAAGNETGTDPAESQDDPDVRVRIYSGASTADADKVRDYTVTRLLDAWSAAVPGGQLAEGYYTVTVTQGDAAGNSRTSAVRHFKIDLTAPAPAIAAAFDGKDFNTRTPQLSGTAETNDGQGADAIGADDATVSVELWHVIGGGQPDVQLPTISGISRSGAGTWSVTLPSLADGTYKARVVQGDSAGNTGRSGVTTFKIDTAAPAVSLTSPPDDTNDRTPDIEGTAGTEDGTDLDASQDLPSVIIDVFSGDSTDPADRILGPVTRDTSGTGAFRIDGDSVFGAEPLAEGTYTVRIKQEDRAGNSSAAALKRFKVDVTRPVVTITRPDAPTNNPTPTIRGTAGNETGSAADRSRDGDAITIRLFKKSGPATRTQVGSDMTATRDGAGDWSKVAPTLTSGTYDVEATQTDAATNVSLTATLTFKVDLEGPAVAIDAIPTPLSRAQARPAITGTAGDASGSELDKVADDAKVHVEIRRLSGTLAASGDVTRTGAAWSFTPPAALPSGTYRVTATQVDALGNASNVATSNEFKVDAVDPLPTVTTPDEGAETSAVRPVITGTGGTVADAEDATADAGTVDVLIWAGASAGTDATAQVVISGVPRNATTGGFTAQVPAGSELTRGTYTIRVRQTDAAGNAGRSAERHFEVDTTAPDLSLTVATPTKAPVLTGTAGTHDGSAANESADAGTVTVRIFRGGTLVETLTTARNATTGAYQAAWTAPADDTYAVEAEQSDAAGNTKVTARETFKVDTQAPAVSVTAPPRAVNGRRPAIGGTAGTQVSDATHSADAATVRVRVLQGGVEKDAFDAAVGAGGAYSEAVHVDLADGVYDVEVTQTDEAGNVSAVATRQFEVDNVEPVVTVGAPPALVSDPRPAISGTAGTKGGLSDDETDVTVAIERGGVQVGSALTATRNAAGSWSTAPAADLASGTYVVSATQRDRAGNVSDTATRTFKVDRSAPALTLDPPLTPANARRPAFSGTRGTAAPAEDNSADEARIAIRILDGTTVADAFDATLSNGTWSAALSRDLADGTYTVEARQSDAAGNVTTRTAVFKVDATAPALSLAAPPAVTGDDTPEVAGIAGTQASTLSASADAPTVGIRILQGSTQRSAFTATVNPATGAFAASVPAADTLAPGTYSAEVTQADEAGNVTTRTRTFKVDTSQPSLTLAVDTPTRAPVLTGTAGTHDGSAADESADAGTVTVRIFRGGALVETLTTARNAATGAYQVAWTAPADDTYTAEAEQSDAAGNTQVTSRETFKVDTRAPSVTVTKPAGFVNTAHPVVEGTGGTQADDATHVADAGTVQIRILRGTTVVDAFDAPLTAGAYSKAVPATLADGDYTVEVTQLDLVGNRSAVASRAFTVDTVAPVVTITAPAALVNVARPSIAGTAGTATGDETDVIVTLERGGVPVGSALTATRNAGGAWSIAPVADLASGTYVAKATQRDAAGNVSAEVTRTFKVDRSAPALTLDPPLSPTNARRPAFTGTRGTAVAAEDDSADDGTVEIRILQGTTVVDSLNATLGNGTWSATPTKDLTDGTYTVEATQADAATNATTRTATFKIDATKPTVTVAAPPADTNDDTPEVSGVAGTQAATPTAAADAATVSIRILEGSTQRAAFTAAVTPATGAYAGSVPAADALAPGTYSAEVTQVDEAGNVTTQTRAFKVDTTAPDLSLTAATPTKAPVLTGTAGTHDGSAADESADAGTVTVRIFRGAALVDTLTAARDALTGAYSRAWTAAPADDTYTAEAEQSDAAGNKRVTSRATFTVDTRAPSVTVIRPNGPGNVQQPVVEGTAGTQAADATHAADAGTVQVRILQGTTVVDAFDAPVTAGAYSKAVPATLADGDYTVEVTQLDLAGNRSAVAGRAFTVDTVAPDVALTAPAPLVTVAKPSIGGTAGNAAGDETTVTVTLLKKNGAAFEAVGSPLVATRAGTTFSIQPAADLASGTYRAEAVQADAAGNASAPATRTFKVDRSAPALTLVKPAPATNVKRPEFTGTRGTAADADDNSADEAKVALRILQGTTVVDAFDATLSNGDWSGKVTKDLADGHYTVEARQADAAGNVTTKTEPFEVDAAGPTVTVTKPAGATNDATPLVEGTAGTAPVRSPDQLEVTIRITRGATAVATFVAPVNATTGAYSASVPDASALTAEGVHDVVVEQLDGGGNKGSATTTFRFDRTAPAVTVTAPAAGSETTDTTPALSGAAGDATGDAANVTLRVFAGSAATGTPAHTLDVNRSGTAWTVDAPVLGLGTYTLTATQADDAGNATTTPARTFTVKAETVPTPVPTVTPVPTPPADTKAPKITLGKTDTSDFHKDRELIQHYTLDEAATVSGELLIDAKLAKKLKLTGLPKKGDFVVLDTARKASAAGADKLKFEVDKKVLKKLLKSKKAVELTVRLTAVDAAGNKSTASKDFDYKPPKKKKNR